MKKAVILFNLGGPDKLENVESFLFNLFNDPAIISVPAIFRYPIAKFISNAGYCSRRDAEKLINQGKVFINNVKCDKPNINVKLHDKISIGKKIIKLEKNIK